jgi:hypothetical protein
MRPKLVVLPVLTVLPVLAFGLSGFGFAEPDPRVAVCEDAVETSLRWPSSFERRDVEFRQEAVGAVVLIEFEARNGYGEPVRNRARCSFADRAGAEEGEDGRYSVRRLTIESALAKAPVLRLSWPDKPRDRVQEAAR